MTISVSGDSTLQNVIGYNSSTHRGDESTDGIPKFAIVIMNDITIERSTNTITDALPALP
jgi:flagellar hook-associated protein 2